MAESNLGKYLYSERMRRGYELLSKYLKDYSNIPISESYYRDIESGRKKIKVDKAEILCDVLKLNKKEFYYHLLKDVLPSPVFDDIVKYVPDTTFVVASDELNKINGKLSRMREAYAEKLLEEPYVVNDEQVKFLDDNFDLLPLIHFVYMKNQCAFKELKIIIEKNKINRSFEWVLHEFEKNEIAIIDREKKVVKRYRRIFRIPRNDIGVNFKNKFLESEVTLSTKSPSNFNESDQLLGPDITYIFSSILCLKSGDRLSKVKDKLVELLAELEMEKNTLDEKEALPYFISVIFSSREKYRA